MLWAHQAHALNLLLSRCGDSNRLVEKEARRCDAVRADCPPCPSSRSESWAVPLGSRTVWVWLRKQPDTRASAVAWTRSAPPTRGLTVVQPSAGRCVHVRHVLGQVNGIRTGKEPHLILPSKCLFVIYYFYDVNRSHFGKTILQLWSIRQSYGPGYRILGRFFLSASFPSHSLVYVSFQMLI